MLYIVYYIGEYAGPYVEPTYLPGGAGSACQHPDECEASLAFWLGIEAEAI